jgi:hypothetical protein
MHIKIPRFTDAQRGPFTPQSAQNRFSESFNSFRKRFRLLSQSSAAPTGLAVKLDMAKSVRAAVYIVKERKRRKEGTNSKDK